MPALSGIARAQTYPTRPVRVIVGYAAGGASDIAARLIGQRLSERLGQSFVVENRPGAASNLATETVVHAPPDGHTLLLVSASNAINATLYDKLNFNFIRDIAPVGSITRGPLVMVVNPSLPAKTVAEFIAYAKANSGTSQHGVGGRRKPAASRGRTVQCHGGDQNAARAVSRRAACADGPDRRTGAGLFRLDIRRDQLRQVRPASRARGDVRDAVRGACRTSRRSANSCRATKRPRGTDLAHRRAHPQR